MKKIWVYDNHTGIVEKLSPLLEPKEISLYATGSLREVEEGYRKKEIHLLILDIHTKEAGFMDGYEMISYFRKMSPAPIIVVSDEKQEIPKIMALDAGADDYITSECSILEVIARLKAQLRRYLGQFGTGKRGEGEAWTAGMEMLSDEERIYQVEGLVINDSTKQVFVNGNPVVLTPIEYKILRLLVQEQGKILSNKEIYETIWRMKPIGSENTIAVHIRHIREKIEENPRQPRYIKVVWGSGYRVCV